MKSTNYNITKYEADEGKVFDWATPRTVAIRDTKGNKISEKEEHLYAKILFIGNNDSIENYIEVDEPVEE